MSEDKIQDFILLPLTDLTEDNLSKIVIATVYSMMYIYGYMYAYV